MAKTGDVEWRVTGQRLTSQLNNAGNGFTSVWEVNYEITSGPASGHGGQVNIPASQYNPETVKAAIAQQAMTLHGVAGL